MEGTTTRTKGLGLFAAVAFAVGNMVGAGVFVLSGLLVAATGPSAVLSFLICGVVVMLSGLSYAALASIYPEDGGGYLYAKRMLGPFVGFLAGWAMYVSVTIATAFVLLGFGIYLNLLAGTGFDPRYAAAAGLVLLTAVNLRGLAEAGRIEVALVVTKVAILCGLIAAGLFALSPGAFVPFFAAGAGGMLRGVTMVFFAYLGFQVVAMMGGEIKSSSRNVPLATLLSIGIVALIYAGVTVALVSAALPSYGSTSVFDAAVVFFGAIGGSIVALGALFSTLSAANANMIGASRIMLEMASERQIPGRFARLTNGQPVNSVLLGSALALLLIIHGNLDFIVNLTNVTTLATMALVNAGAIMLVRKEERVPPEKNYFRLPLGAVIPVLGAISCLLMLVTLQPVTLMAGGGVILLGSVLYLLEDTPAGRRTVLEIRELLGRPR
jgi:APA family basic amino acid/polyamine antiporter